MELQGVVGLQQGGYTNKCVSFGTGRRCVQLRRVDNSRVVVRCGEEAGGKEKEGVAVLKKGSAVVVTQAPPLLKTAEPMPMMRPNNGVINVGDAGREWQGDRVICEVTQSFRKNPDFWFTVLPCDRSSRFSCNCNL